MVIRTALLGALGAALVVSLGCAGPSPQPAIADAERAVQLAEEAQARRYASSELGEALRELRSAQEMAQSSSNWIEARRLAEKASCGRRARRRDGPRRAASGLACGAAAERRGRRRRRRSREG